MSVKPIIEIEVQDDAFKRFYDLFKSYTDDLEQQPEAWRALGAAMGESSKGLQNGALSAKEALAVAAAQAEIIADSLKHATKAQNGLERATDKSEKGMSRLRKSAEGIGKAISTIGGWIVKLGAAAGLGGLLSGIGIGDLAGSAFSRFVAAGRLGLSPGQLASFQVNAQQFLPTSALEAAANTQIDISKAGYLAALGIRYNAARAMSASDLAFAELRSARQAYIDAQRHGLPPMQTPAILSYLALGGSIGDVRNAAMQPLSELEAAQRRTRADVGQLGFDRQTAQAWADLKITLDKAGVTIQSALIDRLAPLAPQIETLADDVANFITVFLNSKNFGIIVDDVKGGLKGLGDFLSQIDWKKFGGEIEWVVDKLGFLAPKKGDKGPINTFLWGHGLDAKSYFNAEKNMPGIRAIMAAIHFAGNGVKDFMGFMNQPFAQTPAGKAYDWAVHGVKSALDGVWANNPLNEKVFDASGNAVWGHFGSLADGIRANAHLLNLYGKQHLDTLNTIIPTWAPAADHNNPSAYIANVEKWSGVPRGLPMSQWSKAQFAAVISAMSRQEGTDPVTISQVIKALYNADVQSHHAQAQAQAHHAKRQRTQTMERRAPRVRPPVHVSVTNSTAARVAVSVNAVAAVS